jgi:hypothetical protein
LPPAEQDCALAARAAARRSQRTPKVFPPRSDDPAISAGRIAASPAAFASDALTTPRLRDAAPAGTAVRVIEAKERT